MTTAHLKVSAHVQMPSDRGSLGSPKIHYNRDYEVIAKVPLELQKRWESSIPPEARLLTWPNLVSLKQHVLISPHQVCAISEDYPNPTIKSNFLDCQRLAEPLKQLYGELHLSVHGRKLSEANVRRPLVGSLGVGRFGV